ncbi:MAG: ABC transporter permease [Ignavibacteriales bacterium]|nr:ABC transporter permease [Ignavibacteriales bacterium]
MKYLQVAKWEFLEKVKSKAFIISLVLMPVIMVGFGVLPGLLVSKPDETSTVVGIYDETGRILQALSTRIEEKYKLPDGRPNYVIRNLHTEGGFGDVKVKAPSMIAQGEMEGYFYIPADVSEGGTVEYRAENVGNIRVSERFSRTIEEVIVEQRLAAEGIDPSRLKRLMADVRVKSIKISEQGEEKESGFLETFFSAYIVIMMLMFLVLTSGQLLIRSVVEEKSNRVIEVLLSSCSARDLMVGKILGLSGLGILQMLLWGIIGLGIALKTGADVFVLQNVLLSLVYFILGYLLYAAIFVAAGSPVTTEQEAQQITTYVSLLLVFPIVLAMPAMQNPDSLWIRILSFIPVLTPAFMVLRIPIQMPPTWEILATMGLLLVSAVGMMWAAGKIFRVAILVYGKRPTIPELWRWMRAS